VGNNGTEDTGEVSGGKGDSELQSFGVFGFGLGVEDMLIHLFDDVFEGNKLHHGVGYLSGP
jgi:hypothetical protein